MIPISFVQELRPIIFQKTATDRQLLLLHRPIYSVRTIQYSRIFVEICASFKQRRTLDDSILSQKDLIEWSASHFKTQTFCAISNFSFVGHTSSFPGNDYCRSEWLPVTHIVHWTKNQQKLSICCHFLTKGWLKFLDRRTASLN